MAHVRIVHTTEYRYARTVRLLPHRLMLRPRDSHDLRLRDATLGLTPPGGDIRWTHDVFGNSIATVDFDERETDDLVIISRLDLEHFPTPVEPWLDPVAETYPFSYAVDEAPDLARLAERHCPDPERVVDRWARRFLSLRGRTGTLDLLIAMTEAIKADFRYEARDAEGTNLPTETLASKSGACRDFALLMMEAARALGFAARFTSGYLYDPAPSESGPVMQGGGATHAWCAIYLPGAGWVEFDPTNGLIAGVNLIRVSVARTPSQAVPVAGGYIGDAGDAIGLDVDVTVTVEPEPA
ncbi:MAG: transglutaminase family protein [Rhodospirillales bacterium]|nr:transglutaminase family protein [Rhodospirillales bacterium]